MLRIGLYALLSALTFGTASAQNYLKNSPPRYVPPTPQSYEVKTPSFEYKPPNFDYKRPTFGYQRHPKDR